MTVDCEFNIHMIIFIFKSLNNFDLLKQKRENFKMYFVFSKVQIIVWSLYGMRDVLMFAFARFEFDSVFYCNFFRFEFHLLVDCNFW